MDLSKLPLDPNRREALRVFCRRLRDVLGEDLRTVLVHGDAVTGDGLGELAGLDVLLVVSDLDRDHLDRMAEAVAEARRVGHISVMTLSPAEVAGATDVFPIKFLELRRTGTVIHGEDPFAGMQIGRDHLRLRCEQELRNVVMRLRHHYLLRAGGHGGLAPVLGQFLPPLLRALRYLLVLRGEETEEMNSAAVLERACEVLGGQDRGLAADLLAAARGTEGRGKLVKLLIFMMRLAGEAADAADRIEAS